MKAINITCTKREATGKTAAKQMRRVKQVPCVVYRATGTIHFQVEESEFKDLIYSPAFTIAKLNIEGTEVEAMVKDTQFHPVTDALLHVEFQELVPGKVIFAEVPVKLVGRALGVIEGGKVLTKTRRLRVKAKPEDLSDYLSVDVSHLEIGKSVKVEDLVKRYKNIQFLNSPSIPVATVTTTRALRSAATKAAKDDKSEVDADVETGAEENEDQ